MGELRNYYVEKVMVAMKDIGHRAEVQPAGLPDLKYIRHPKAGASTPRALEEVR